MRTIEKGQSLLNQKREEDERAMRILQAHGINELSIEDLRTPSEVLESLILKGKIAIESQLDNSLLPESVG